MVSWDPGEAALTASPGSAPSVASFAPWLLWRVDVVGFCLANDLLIVFSYFDSCVSHLM